MDCRARGTAARSWPASSPGATRIRSSAPDGSLYFLAHAGRHPERLSTRESDARRHRRHASPTSISGVSGITPLTPAMSAASARQRAGVHRLRERPLQHLRGRHVAAGRRSARWRPTRRNAAVLPPANRRARHRAHAAAEQHDRAAAAARLRGHRLPREAAARGHQPADRRRRRRSIRRLRGRRHLLHVQRHPERSHARRDGAVDQPHPGNRRAGRLPQSQVALELGRRRRAPAVRDRRLRPGLAVVDGQQVIVQETRARHAAQLGRERALRSIRSARCSAPSSPSARGGSASTRRSRRSSSRRSPESCSTSRPRSCPAGCDQPRRGERGAGLRLVDLRRDQPARRPPLSLRVLADGRHADLRRPAGRLPPLLHAGAPVHVRGARPALRPLRRRR